MYYNILHYTILQYNTLYLLYYTIHYNIIYCTLLYYARIYTMIWVQALGFSVSGFGGLELEVLALTVSGGL